MKTLPLLSTIALLSASLLANPYQSQQEIYDNSVKTGEEVSNALLQTLGKNLKTQMKSEGPIGAAKFCMTEAYPLTDDVSEKFGKDIHVKRISQKYRNPANAPVGSEQKIMEALQSLQENNVVLPKHLVERVDNNTVKYYKPLSINKGVCLKCHGNIAENQELFKFMTTNYPEDRAIGYKMGDLRGAIVVTITK